MQPKKSAGWFRFYRITYGAGRNPPNVKSRCCCFSVSSVDSKGPRTHAFVFGCSALPSAVFHPLHCLGNLGFIASLLFKAFQHPLSTARLLRWVLPRPPHKTDFGFSNNLSPAVEARFCISPTALNIQCKGPILRFLLSH